jgi:hypothetical protein
MSQELFGVAQFGLVVVFASGDTEFDFLELAGGGLFGAFLFLFAQLVFVFAKIEDPADRGFGVGGNLYQIQSCALSQFEGFLWIHDPDHLSARAYYANFAAPYAVIFANVVFVSLELWALALGGWITWHSVIRGGLDPASKGSFYNG